MHRCRFPLAAAVAAASLMALPAHAAEVDLSGWKAVTLAFPGGQGAANWALETGNKAVTQTRNADPAFFLNDTVQGSYSIEGSFEVRTTSDDDYIGFAFGYQNSSNFYLFDWKKSGQSYAGGVANEGMTIKKFTGSTGDGLVDLSLLEFWENRGSYGDMTVLAQNHSTSAGWVSNRVYSFALDFNVMPGEFKVVVKDGSTVLWDRTVADSTFKGGQFGFYNFSQQSVRYAGFTQDVLPPPIPEPGTWALMLGGLAAVAGLRARRRT